ncbi:hypothetical protein P154DRAFT_423333 [Amniculicola lignicola CBS 123094]|uniref:CST complex subunit Ten1 n=1 Tax=Amniculicola lignicola CBS 123094 TaxID=1392246 RepID=A0A6A5WWE1_9PLEO|nr:hypothetical protein P154DRAFT_423333 [Amniculicola lignicola CBS 123094]
MAVPVASQLVLLSDVGKVEAGVKVRFLGCIEEYHVATGRLRLKHDYPSSLPPPTFVFVDVEHVLETVKHTDLDVGAWINVIGYVERRKEQGVFVQAITIWNAGNVDLDAYQKAVEARKRA